MLDAEIETVNHNYVVKYTTTKLYCDMSQQRYKTGMQRRINDLCHKVLVVTCTFHSKWTKCGLRLTPLK